MKYISSYCFEPLPSQADVSDRTFVNSIASHIDTYARGTTESSAMYLETVGGGLCL
jgi:hypothetical protein